MGKIESGLKVLKGVAPIACAKWPSGCGGMQPIKCFSCGGWHCGNHRCEALICSLHEKHESEPCGADGATRTECKKCRPCHKKLNLTHLYRNYSGPYL